MASWMFIYIVLLQTFVGKNYKWSDIMPAEVFLGNTDSMVHHDTRVKKYPCPIEKLKLRNFLTGI